MMNFRHSEAVLPDRSARLQTVPPGDVAGTGPTGRPVAVTIIGAGPYGLSVAAHLHHRGVDFRIIGSTMSFWSNNMPRGMQLKSTGFSSTLYDPERSFTIRSYCEDRGIPFEDVGLPVKIETFIAFGMAFQKAMVPNVEDAKVARLDRGPAGFIVTLDNGESFASRNVVVGVGLDYFRTMPPELAQLPRDLATHSADHHDLSRFRGSEVAVFGGGSSAIDLAVLLHEAGARPLLIVRKPSLEFGPDEPLKRSLLDKLHAPMSGVGPGWKNRACTDLPWAFRHLPEQVRVKTVREFLGPAGGWFMKSRMEPVARLLGHELRSASESGGRLQLRLAAIDGSERNLTVDHAIAATGFRQDARKLPFLSPNILGSLSLLSGMPRLSASFESSVPGLYFIGPIAANTFGPVMRFSIGAGYTSRRLASHLARVAISQRSFST